MAVAVANVVADVAVSGPSSGNANQVVTFNTILTNHNPSDTYTRTWTLTRNGVEGPLKIFTSTIIETFDFAAAQGSYTITLVLTDDDGFSVTKMATYTVDSAADGKADIITYSNGVWSVGVSTGSNFGNTWTSHWGSSSGPVATGDFNGDGATDILRLEGRTCMSASREATVSVTGLSRTWGQEPTRI